MNYSTILLVTAATWIRLDPRDSVRADEPAGPTLDEVLEQNMSRLRELADQFRRGTITPAAFAQFERDLQNASREADRALLESVVNTLEPHTQDCPQHLHFEQISYTRCPRKTPHTIATLFGKIILKRLGYRPTDKRSGETTLFPLERQLGIACSATPALAECAARYHAEAGATQRRTLQRLKQEHHIDWSPKTLRKLITHLSMMMSEQRHDVQVEKLLELLGQAAASTGRYSPVISVGRDGITIGINTGKAVIWEVASAGTVSVLDRRGRRLGTVYLAYTPEEKQPAMSNSLTQLILDVLRRWSGTLPRLAYVTDAGDNETSYYENVLRKMRHPNTDQKLEWIRVVDFYHACERVTKMAEALFGPGPAAQAWSRRMRTVLKEPGGVRRMLLSAAALRSRYKLKGDRLNSFKKHANYLRTRSEFMRYATYRRLRLPIGSGVTEAGCKTIYTQRMKLSGMRWQNANAQDILNLRVLLLSNVWNEAYRRVLNRRVEMQVPTYGHSPQTEVQIAA